MLKLRYSNFKPIFLRMQFSLVATFFLYFWLSVWAEICILNFLMSFQRLYHLTFGDKSVRALDFQIYLHLLKMHRHHNRQGSGLVVEAPKHDPLFKWSTWGHAAVWKICISIFIRFIANKLGRLQTWGKTCSTQKLKSSPASCCTFVLAEIGYSKWKIKSVKIQLNSSFVIKISFIHLYDYFQVSYKFGLQSSHQ